jgi:hypothetical protein
VKTHTQRRMPPEPGAVRIHRLAPATEDAWSWVRDKLAEQGWKVLETDYQVEGGETQYAMVSAWAIPLNHDEDCPNHPWMALRHCLIDGPLAPRRMEEEGGTA